MFPQTNKYVDMFPKTNGLKNVALTYMKSTQSTSRRFVCCQKYRSERLKNLEIKEIWELKQMILNHGILLVIV